MKTGKATPSTIVYINDGVNFLVHQQRVMKGHLKAISTAHKNIALLRKKASNDGEPGSNEAFNLPVVELQEDCDRLITLAQNIKAHASVLLAHNPEEWK